MRIRSAASVARVLVIVHLVLFVVQWLMYVGSMLEAARYGATNVIYLFGWILGFCGTIALDVGLLIILSSLCRTTEDLLRDNPETPIPSEGGL